MKSILKSTLNNNTSKLKKILMLIIATTFFHASLFAQENKKVAKAIEVFNSGKFNKAIGSMKKIVSKESTSSNWDVLVEMSYYRYKFAVEQESDNLTNQLIQALGNTSDNKIVVSDLRSVTCFSDLVTTCKNAGLYSQSLIASMYLRTFFVDYQPDSIVSVEAKKVFKEAEAFFSKKDYNNAKINYQKALLIHPSFYKATIYLGDCHWYLNNMDSAIHYFQKGIDMCPDLLEPRKYLVDALTYSKQYEKGKKECIDAIYIYPDQSMYDKYADLLKKSGSLFNKHWIKRECEINAVENMHTKTNDPTWKHYQNAKSDVEKYCDKNGVIQPNELTKSKYLEVYSWGEMLNSLTAVPKELKFAKKMADLGYLDCYVFISQFHFDLYPQYLDFVQYNKDRIKTYIEMYLTE